MPNQDAVERVSPRFGDIVENGWASKGNPTRVGYFVREGRRTGRMNPGRFYEVTDGKGKFWELSLFGDHKITVRASEARALAAEASLEWKPIETAPRDGTLVWAWYGPEGFDVCWYDEGATDAPDDMGYDAGWWGHLYAVPGRSFGNPDHQRAPQGQPTHWRPLPDPPKADEILSLRVGGKGSSVADIAPTPQAGRASDAEGL